MDLAEVFQALERADAAGDIAAARALAQMAMGMGAGRFLPTAPEKPEPGRGFVAGMQSSWEGMKGDVGAIGAAMGVEGAEKYAKEQSAKSNELYAQPEFTKHPVDYVTGMLGKSIPYMVAPAAAAIAAPEAAVAGVSAATLAAIAAGTAQFTGTNLSRQMDEGVAGKDLNATKAVLAAVPQAVLDRVSMGMIPGLRGVFAKAGTEISEEAAKRIATQGLMGTLADYGFSALKTAGAEGVTEAAQQFLERMQAGLDLTDAKARDEYWQSLIGGAVLGGTLAPAGRFFERGNEKRKGEQLNAEEVKAQRLQERADEEALAPFRPANNAKQGEFQETAITKEERKDLIARRRALPKLGPEVPESPIGYAGQQLDLFSPPPFEEPPTKRGKKTKPEAEAPAGAEAPVAPGMVRYYHGGSPEEVTGSLWFTSDLRNAKGWANRSPSMRLWYVDVPADSAVRGGEPEFGVLPPSNMEFPAEIAAQRKLLAPTAKPNGTQTPEAQQAAQEGPQASLFPAEPAPEVAVEPAVAPPTTVATPELVANALTDVGAHRKPGVVKWFANNVQGKTAAELLAMKIPDTKDTPRVLALKAIITQLRSAPDVPANAVTPEQANVAGGNRPSVGSPSVSAGAPDVGGVSATEPAQPSGHGLGPAGSPVGAGVRSEGTPTPAVGPITVVKQQSLKDSAGTQVYRVELSDGSVHDIVREGRSYYDKIRGDTEGYLGDSKAGAVEFLRRGAELGDHVSPLPSDHRERGAQLLGTDLPTDLQGWRQKLSALEVQRKGLLDTRRKLHDARGDAPSEETPAGKQWTDLTYTMGDVGGAMGIAQDHIHALQANEQQTGLHSPAYLASRAAWNEHRNARPVAPAVAPILEPEAAPEVVAAQRAELTTALQAQHKRGDPRTPSFYGTGTVPRAPRPPLGPTPEPVAELPPLSLEEHLLARVERAKNEMIITPAVARQISRLVAGGRLSQARAKLREWTDASKALNDREKYAYNTFDADPPHTEAGTVTAAIQGKHPVQIARWLAETHPDQDQRDVLRKVAYVLAETEKRGARLTFNIGALGAGERGVTRTTTAPDGRAHTNITVQPATTAGSVGTSYETVAHELVHAATSSAVHAGRLPQFVHTPLGHAVARLSLVLKATRAELTRRQGKGALTSFEKALSDKAVNALADEDEILTWAMTNPEMKRWLSTIPYTPTVSLWKAFVGAVRNVLGLSPSADTALSEVLNQGKVILDTHPATAVQSGAPRTHLQRTARTPDAARFNAISDKIIAPERTRAQKVRNAAFGLLGIEGQTRLVDNFAGLEKLSRGMEHLAGTQMMYYARMFNQRMHFVARAVSNGAVQRVEKPRADGTKEYVFESTGGASLKNVVHILSTAPGNLKDVNKQFSLYLVAERAKRVGLNKLHYGNAITQADLNEVDDLLAANSALMDTFDAARREYNAYNKGLVRFAVDCGAISPDLAAKLTHHNDYVPFYRAMADGSVAADIGGETIQGFGNLANSPDLRELLGGNSQIVDFMTSAVQNTSMMMDYAMRNMATKNAAHELRNIGLAKIVKGHAVVGKDVIRFKDKGEDMSAVIDSASAGVPSTVLVHGMSGLPIQMTWLMKAASVPSRILRKSVVMSPLYMMRQITRDSLAAPILSGANFTPILGALKQLNSVHRGTLENRGIVGGQVFTGTNEDLGMVLRSISQGKGGWGKSLAYLEGASMEADALTRRAQYESYLKQGLSEMEATYLTLESMNFSTRGTSPTMQFMSTMIPFFNAQVQSLNVLVKTFRGNMPMSERLQMRRKLYTRGTMLAVTSMVYAGMMQDDEAYRNATPDQKYGNWFVRIPGVSEPLRIPIPFEIGYIFKALPEAMVNIMASKHGDEEAFKAFKHILQQLIPGGSSTPSLLFPVPIPQAMRPAIEASLGRSFYTGQDIETLHEKTLDPGKRVRPGTSGVSRELGDALGVSPLIMDHLIKGYFGGLGLAITQVVGAALPERGRVVEQPTPRPSDMPVFGGMFQPNDAGGIIASTYERMLDAEKAKNTFNELVNRGQPEEAKAYLKETADRYAQSDLSREFQASMLDIKKAEDAVRASSETAESKRDKLTKLRALKIQISENMRTVGDKVQTSVAARYAD